MQERRKQVRVNVQLLGKYALVQGATASVQGEVLGTVAEGEVHNVSAGGVLLSTSRPLPLAANVRLAIEIPGDPAPLRVWGRVTWVAEDQHGIEIVDVEDDDRERIDEIVLHRLHGDGPT